MTFSFDILDAKKLKSKFLHFKFIDVVVTKDVLLMFGEQGDIFHLMTFKVNVMQDFSQEKGQFRIPTLNFFTLLDSCNIRVTVTDTTVWMNIKFISDRVVEFSFPVQTVFRASLNERIGIINDVESYQRVDLKSLELITKLSVRTDSVLTIDNGVAFVVLNDCLLYAKTGLDDVALIVDTFSTFLKQSHDRDKIYRAKNFLVYSGANEYTMLTTCIPRSKSNYRMTMSQPVQVRLSLNIDKCLFLIAKTKKFEKVAINLYSETFSIFQEGTKFSCPVERLEPKEIDLMQELPEVELSSEIFKNIIANVKTSILNFEYTKRLLRVRISDDVVLVKGR